MAAIVTGVAPDIFEYWGMWFAKLHQKGQLMDVQPLVDATMTEEDVADFVPNEWDDFGRLSLLPNKRAAMPRCIDFMCIHYNKTILDEDGVTHPDMGWTVDDIAEAAAKLTKRDASGEAESSGGAFVEHKVPKECLTDTPKSQEALEWMRRRYWEDRTCAEPLLTDRSWGYSIYANGYAARIEDGGPRFALARDVKGIYDVDFFHPPKGPVRRSSYLVTDGYGMWLHTKWPDAS